MAQETALGLKLSSKPTNSSQVIFSRAFLPLDDWPNATVELASNMVATTAVAIRFNFILVSLMDFLVVQHQLQLVCVLFSRILLAHRFFSSLNVFKRSRYPRKGFPYLYVPNSLAGNTKPHPACCEHQTFAIVRSQRLCRRSMHSLLRITSGYIR